MFFNKIFQHIAKFYNSNGFFRVTAAVYWAFNKEHQEFSRYPFPYVSSTGQVSDPILCQKTLQSLVFLLNSRSSPLLCYQIWTSIFRSYGVSLPSSFNTVLSILFICSTSLPVSDSVRFFFYCFFQVKPFI